MDDWPLTKRIYLRKIQLKLREFQLLNAVSSFSIEDHGQMTYAERLFDCHVLFLFLAFVCFVCAIILKFI